MNASPQSTPGSTAYSASAHALSVHLRADLIGDAEKVFTGLEAAELAGSSHLTFVRSGKFAGAFAAGKAGGALVKRGMDLSLLGDLSGRVVLLVDDPDLAMLACLEMFAPQEAAVAPGVHASAVIAADARVHATAHVGPNCTVHAGAVIGAGVVLVSDVTVGAAAVVGDGTLLHPGVRVLSRCVVGRQCIIHSGVVIGADGFGYRPDPSGRGLLKIPHIGNVVIGDAVEIGANTCVDRAKFGSTTIGSGTKIDNLVQIAHNCRVGRCCVICGNAGLAGSVVMGDGVIVGGGASIADNLTIGSGVKVAGGSGVMDDIPAGETWMGMPAGPASEWRRIFVGFKRMGRRDVKKPKGSSDGAAT
jgi:UDP-3-O-[3-hydroxymyristoyl] glucosamine N-acyltransferase